MTHSPSGVTQDHWVYLCYASDGLLLYVGITARGLARPHEHAKRAAWAADVARIDVEHYPTVEEALDRESFLIADRKPLHNIQQRSTFDLRRRREPAPSRWLSLDDLADWLGAESSWVEHKLKEGMPHAIVAGNLRFRAAAVVRWLG